MKKQMEMKSRVLDMLKDFLMTSEGGKFAPRSVEVEVVSEPKSGSLKDFLEEASEAAPEPGQDRYEDSTDDRARDAAGAERRGQSLEEYEECEEDEERDAEFQKNMPRRRSPREYFSR